MSGRVGAGTSSAAPLRSGLRGICVRGGDLPPGRPDRRDRKPRPRDPSAHPPTGGLGAARPTRLPGAQSPNYPEPSRFRLGAVTRAPRPVLTVILTLGLLAAPLAAGAQEAGQVHRIGLLSPPKPLV